MDVRLRERIVGALVLIALATLLVPLVFDDAKDAPLTAGNAGTGPEGEPVRVIHLSSPRPLDELANADHLAAAKTTREPVLETAASPTGSTAVAASAVASGGVSDGVSEDPPKQSSPNVANVHTEPPATAAGNASPAPASTVATTTTPTTSPEKSTRGNSPATQTPAAQSTPAKVAAKPAEPARALPETVSGYVVQAGLFSSADGAKKVVAQLRGLKMKAYVRQEKQGDRVLSRVLIGPLSSRAEADAIKAKMKSAAQMDGMVAPFDPLKH